ncbi:MAG TPA: hypothetical protein VFD71_21685 [Planctomycetota bacterium]|jgi:hypothetical protein|nr:hypothetical protein [Planctomycetota bacterium]
MQDAAFYFVVAAVYALVGAVLSVAYYAAPKLRSEPVFHAMTLLVMVLACLVVALGATAEFETFGAFHRGLELFLFAGATLLYVPVIVYLMLHYWGLLIECILSPGSRKESQRAPQGRREEWQRIQACLETLAVDPTSAPTHEKLGDLYTGMGFLDSAVYQYQKAANWMETGYGQASVLYKAARVLIEKKSDVRGSLGILRRIVRLYPKSFFAAYARRVINQYEAHEAVRNAPRLPEDQPPKQDPTSSWPSA